MWQVVIHHAVSFPTETYTHEKSIQHFHSLETMEAFLQEYTKSGPALIQIKRVDGYIAEDGRTVIRIGGVR